MRTLTLASGSPRRRWLLERAAADPPFATLIPTSGLEVAPADVDETPMANETPAELALRLASAKARAVAADRTDGLVLGADTIVVLGGGSSGGEILGKPADEAAAVASLERLRARRHDVITAVCVVDAATGRSVSGTEQTAVWLRRFSDAELRSYVATGDPYDKAGGYAIQHGDFQPVARLQGSETNVIGLPMGLVKRLIARL